ncbi:hypothetical protein [Sneathiella chinensis]|uniref:Uncharacterized protein n=1 Tax=Sneathiella chinensis TaxID=349750 RepID=A0ABQ5U7Y6_9PROT|nr:hypothetical protein [Sneathiella chinensis]GLQ07521.1 hypothetical protein GCM10007924_27420 [Sneathiella chinensis]
MNAEETRAAQLIYYGFQFRTTGLGFRTSLYEAMPRGSAPNDDWQADVIRQFLAWATACQAEGLSVAAALDIIVFGRSCRETDKARRKRKGYARDTLKACLEIYVNLRKTP